QCEVIQCVSETTKQITIRVQADKHTLIDIIFLLEDHVHCLVDLFTTYGRKKSKPTCVDAKDGYSGFTNMCHTFEEGTIATKTEEQVNLSKAFAWLVGFILEFSELGKTEAFLEAG